MKKYVVGVSRFPGSGWEFKHCVGWLIRTVCQMKNDPRIERVESIEPYSDTPITMARNKAVLDARRAGCDYLLMVDSDMSPDGFATKRFWPTAWEFFMARHPSLPPATIAAPYCGPPPHELPFVFHWTNQQSDHPDPDFRLEMYSRHAAALMTGIVEVPAMPTGLIVYDMRVFDILPPPWFRYEYKDPEFESEKCTTEDVYQTRNAHLLGLPQYMAMDSWAGHCKPKIVGKPVNVYRDQVHKSLVEAVQRGVDRGDQLVMVKPREEKPISESFVMPGDGTPLESLLAAPPDVPIPPEDQYFPGPAEGNDQPLPTYPQAGKLIEWDKLCEQEEDLLS